MGAEAEEGLPLLPSSVPVHRMLLEQDQVNAGREPLCARAWRWLPCPSYPTCLPGAAKVLAGQPQRVTILFRERTELPPGGPSIGHPGARVTALGLALLPTQKAWASDPTETSVRATLCSHLNVTWKDKNLDGAAAAGLPAGTAGSEAHWQSPAPGSWNGSEPGLVGARP